MDVLYATGSTHELNSPQSYSSLGDSQYLSPSFILATYSYHDDDVLAYPCSPLEYYESFSNDFQSNLASLRTTTGLPTGLGIDCAQLSNYQDTSEVVTSPGFLYGTPLFSTDTLSVRLNAGTSKSFKRDCHSAESPGIRQVTIHDHSLLPSVIPSAEQSTANSFYALSAASGLLPQVLATHISATAEIALQHLSNSHLPLQSGADSNAVSQPEPVGIASKALICPIPEMVPPMADINMHQFMMPLNETSTSVNPADTLPGYHFPFLFTMPTPEISFAEVGDFDSDEKINHDVVGTIPNCLGSQDIVSLPLSNDPLDTTEEQKDRKQEQELSEYEPSLHSSPSDFNFSPIPILRRQRASKRRIVQQTFVNEFTVAMPQSDSFDGMNDSRRDYYQAPVVVEINLGTPMPHAYLGIPLSELHAKAERYRNRNNISLSLTGEVEFEYDKRWLMSFAGRLSERGDLIHDFRCYIVGCTQMNKRRDHILIHLGAHLGQRPFKCGHCPARFLRKNECKRHELSHTGARPFLRSSRSPQEAFKEDP
ncbi:hypothetical protein AMATHDRAFT_2047 [Amanita thiersii Skay4041]|uniref:C2H2-type domain-containing protein n=1 Tax=Amanita thiersii Skay4041 TaxID=703135 RepID=A0A2A9NXX3_9AGAR|nr:hypothetical protein AMATHDRAFT_2047 [Amanita thiersii Skay4041]